MKNEKIILPYTDVLKKKKKKKKRQGREVYLFKIHPIDSDRPIK